jgi:hypothetical protein
VRGLSFILLAFLLAGCAFGGSDAPEEVGSDGLTRYQISAGHFSIGVPDTWHATTSTQLRKASFKRFANQTPAFAPYARTAGKKNSPLKFFAYDPVIRKRFATNLNVVVMPARENLTPERYRQAAIAEAKDIAASRPTATDVDLEAGKAVRLEYRARFVVGGREKMMWTRQYALLVNGTSYVLTYTTLAAFRDDYADTFERSAVSFQLLDR